MKKQLLTIAISAVIEGAASIPVYAEQAIEHILVSAARDGIIASNSGSSVSVIDTETLNLRKNTTLADLLRSVPGVSVNQASGLGSQIQLRIRGGEANHVLVFIDGVQVNDPAQGDDFNFAHLINQDIDSIEVVRGPQSAIWGSDALSGMIYIKTKHGNGGETFSAFAEGGSFNTQRAGISGSLGTAEKNVRVSLSSTDRSGTNVSTFGNELDGYKNNTAKINGSAKLSNNTSIYSSFIYIDSKTAFDSLDYNTDENWAPLNVATYGLPIDANNLQSSQQLYGQLGIQYHSTDNTFKHSASLAFSRGNNHNQEASVWATSGFDDTFSKAQRKQLTIQSSAVLSEEHELTAALEKEHQQFDLQSTYLSGNESMNSSALAVQLKGKIVNTWHYLLSARVDNNDDFGNASTYRISTVWHANESLSVRSALGTGIKNPTFTELYGYSSSFIGNPNLEPEASISWEVGADLRMANQRGTLSVTYFDETLDNEISTVYDYSDWTSTSINETHKSDRSGVEISFDGQLSTAFNVGAAASKLQARQPDAFSGELVREIRRPEYTASAYVEWHSHDNKTSVAINADYNGDMTDTFFGTSAETVKLQSYTLLSINMRYQVSDQISAYSRFENALNNEYQEIYGFNTPGASAIFGLQFSY